MIVINHDYYLAEFKEKYIKKNYKKIFYLFYFSREIIDNKVVEPEIFLLIWKKNLLFYSQQIDVALHASISQKSDNDVIRAEIGHYLNI